MDGWSAGKINLNRFRVADIRPGALSGHRDEFGWPLTAPGD